MIATCVLAMPLRKPKYKTMIAPMKISRISRNLPCVNRYVLQVS